MSVCFYAVGVFSLSILKICTHIWRKSRRKSELLTVYKCHSSKLIGYVQSFKLLKQMVSLYRDPIFTEFLFCFIYV
jgi:hypothetical protein